MSKFKHAAQALAAASLMAVQAHATQVQAQSPQVVPVATFSQADINTMFDQAGQPMQLVALSSQEMKETEGAWLNFAIGGAAGFGFYAASNWYNNQPITWQGSLYSIGTGAFTGGVGGSLIRASGGGIAGNMAWRPNILASNFGFSQYRSSRGW